MSTTTEREQPIEMLKNKMQRKVKKVIGLKALATSLGDTRLALEYEYAQKKMEEMMFLLSSPDFIESYVSAMEGAWHDGFIIGGGRNSLRS